MALDGDSFCGASRKALRLLESHGTLAGLLDEVLADALDLVQLFGTWALVLVAIYLGRSAGVCRAEMMILGQGGMDLQYVRIGKSLRARSQLYQS